MKLIHLDTCLPDYFRGHHKPVMAIPVDGTTTATQFIEAIKDEYLQVWDYLTNEGQEDENAWPNVSQATIEFAARELLTVSGDELVHPDLDVYDDDDEFYDSVYTYITWE